jgi:hypothetical protein
MLYQNDRPVAPVGAVNDWLIDESPLVGAGEDPSCAAYVPLCGPLVVTVAVPDGLQPERLPVSKSPLVMPTAAAAGVAVAAVTSTTAVMVAATTATPRKGLIMMRSPLVYRRQRWVIAMMAFAATNAKGFERLPHRAVDRA